MSESIYERPQVVVIGGGPAGLTAAYELVLRDLHPVVLEQQAVVGGLARTESYRGFHFDMGGHRFFTKVAEIEAIWRRVLGDDFVRRPRLSRIFYDGRFFHYPLRPWNALAGLGPWQSALVAISYLRWQLMPYHEEETFEQWVTNRFGRRLFRTFFKTYTEKVWGVSCSELKAEWAAQRIKDLSLRTAVLNMFMRPQTTIKTLIEEFDYPRLGPGMMWNAVRVAVERGGGVVRTGSEVAAIGRDGQRIQHVVIATNGTRETLTGTHFISSMPITELVARLDPPAPPDVRAAAEQLTYRDFLTVCLIVGKADLFPDNWIYIHDPAVRVGRIQNFKNWSPDMVPDRGKTSLGLEYFCSEGDDLWCMPDADLIELGKREIAHIGLADAEDVVDGCVTRVPKAYPVYDARYRQHLDVVRRFVDGLTNLQTIGRNGLHRYNNQDHAMLTGILAVRNLVDDERNDLWSVNTDQEYHEEVRSPEERAVEDALVRIFAKVDRRAFGLALGIVGGLGLFLATLFLVLKGGAHVGPHLALLGQYFPGYHVTSTGSILGLAYGFLASFCVGWGFAVIRNATFFLYEFAIRRRAESGLFGRFLDSI
ncbi:MAG: NAD(P)/FAD-dependent oxidoreductase [Deltaproteobacteria bacterium]|nr:NAD(P)/FAD-dependent oxidoreductase [Deltaproteobacteria bacterium]